jgi:hypothetical protein
MTYAIICLSFNTFGASKILTTATSSMRLAVNSASLYTFVASMLLAPVHRIHGRKTFPSARLKQKKLVIFCFYFVVSVVKSFLFNKESEQIQ